MTIASFFFALGLGGCVLLTSMISAVFGMAGGLILMLILGVLLPVPAAMVLHGVTQMVSNGWRAFLWREWIAWGILSRYAIGAAPAALIPLALVFVPSKPAMLIMLGLVPFLALMIPASMQLDALKPSHAYACGFSVAGVQIMAGVAGPLLDTFFVRSSLDRRAVVATKAATQTLSHIMKVAYYGTLASVSADLTPSIFTASILAAIAGTTLAAPILEKMTDASFRKWTQTIVLITGGASIAQGLWLWLMP